MTEKENQLLLKNIQEMQARYAGEVDIWVHVDKDVEHRAYNITTDVFFRNGDTEAFSFYCFQDYQVCCDNLTIMKRTIKEELL